MIWSDNNRLSVVADSHDGPVNGPSTYKGITISYSTYQNRINDDRTFSAANVSKKSFNIGEADVSGEAAEEKTKTGRNCVLSISAKDGATFDKIGTRIEASINRCNRASSNLNALVQPSGH